MEKVHSTTPVTYIPQRDINDIVHEYFVVFIRLVRIIRWKSKDYFPFFYSFALRCRIFLS